MQHILWRYNSHRVLAFSTISFHLRRPCTCSVHFISFILFRSFLTSFLTRSTRVSCLPIISLSFLCREFLACQIFRDEFAGLVLNPRYLGGPRISCVVFLSGFVPIIASGTRVSPLHGLAARRRFQGP